MKEPSADDKPLTLLKLSRALCFVALLVPAAVLLVCYVLSALNESAGWLRYPLPGLLLLAYLLSGLASPLVGAAALVVLFIGRRAQGVGAGGDERHGLRRQVLILGLLDLFAVLFWALLFPYVYFSAGAGR